MSVEVARSAAARIAGWPLDAAASAVYPTYDSPNTAIVPSDHAWRTIHSHVSYPSRASCSNGSATPSLP